MRSERRSDEELARMMEIWEQLPSDVEGLVEKLADPDHLVRMQTAMSIGGLEDPAGVEPLLAAIEDEHPEVRASAALSLGRLRDPRAVSALSDHIAHDPAPKVRAMSVWAAGMIGTDAAMEGVESALADADEHIRSAACSQFVGNGDHRAVPQIRELLAHPDPLLRSGAADMLILLGLVDEQVWSTLGYDPSWEVRQSVAEELIRAKVADRRIVAAIERLMLEPEAEEYEASVVAQTEMMKEADCCDTSEDEELSEEDKREIEETFEDMRSKPLAELLDRARSLLEK